MGAGAREPLLTIEAPGVLFSGLIDDALNRCGVLTRASASTRSGHYNGGVGSSDKVTKRPTKNLLLLFPNGLTNPLGLELLEL